MTPRRLGGSPAFPSARGFTLLELMVALAIFAVVAALAYGGLSQVLAGGQRAEQRLDELAALQRALTLLERDLLQAAPRGIRDEYGDPQPPFKGDGTVMELTRAGAPNSTGRPLSTLRRIAWRVDGERLLRLTWSVLDRAPDSAPLEAEVLTGVTRWQLRYRGDDGEWQAQWPTEQTPVATPAADGLSGDGMAPGGKDAANRPAPPADAPFPPNGKAPPPGKGPGTLGGAPAGGSFGASDAAGEAQPGGGDGTEQEEGPPPLPAAVEVTLEREGWGEIVRLIPLPR